MCLHIPSAIVLVAAKTEKLLTITLTFCRDSRDLIENPREFTFQKSLAMLLF